MNTDKLRKQAVSVYLAAEEGPADDLSKSLRWAADRIDWLERKPNYGGCDLKCKDEECYCGYRQWEKEEPDANH